MACAETVSQEGPSQEVHLAMDNLFDLLDSREKVVSASPICRTF